MKSTMSGLRISCTLTTCCAVASVRIIYG